MQTGASGRWMACPTGFEPVAFASGDASERRPDTADPDSSGSALPSRYRFRPGADTRAGTERRSLYAPRDSRVAVTPPDSDAPWTGLLWSGNGRQE
jgi:hypothetical protein